MCYFSEEITRVEREYKAESESENGFRAISEEVDLSVLLGFGDMQDSDEPDLIVELIDLYLADVPQRLKEMNEFVLKADKVSLKRAAHNLKGSSANLGVKSVANLCESLEQTDSTESFREANILINRLERSFERVRPVFLATRQSRF